MYNKKSAEASTKYTSSLYSETGPKSKQSQVGNQPGPKKPAYIKDETKFIDSVFKANMDKPWVKRLYDEKPKTIPVKGTKERATHLMESGDGLVYPRVDTDKTGKLINMGDTAIRHHLRSNSAIKFKNDEEAQWFGANYKKGTGVLKGFKAKSKSKQK